MLICDKIISIKVKNGAMLMAYENMLIDLAKQNNGIITAKMATEAGILNGSIKYLVDNGKLERVARGVFVLPDAWEDEFVTWQSKYKRGIYSLDTALFLLDLTDRTPGKFNMTFPSKYNVSNPKKDGIICNSLKFDIYNEGIIELKTPMGNMVKAYNAEKTLCDILRIRNRVDIQVVSEAFKRYVSQPANIPLLSKYAKMLKVEDKLRSYIEVLL